MSKIISLVGLGLTVGPSLLVLNNLMSVETYKQLMMLGTLLWIISAPLWMQP